MKVDPALVSKARELRDRYLEQVNDGQLIAPSGAKYDVSRILSHVEGARALPATVPPPREAPREAPREVLPLLKAG